MNERSEWCQVLEISNAKNSRNVIENLKRMHDLPRIHLCGKNVYLTDTVKQWLEGRVKDTHRRTLPLTDGVVEMLAAHQAEQPDGYPYVFLPPERYDHIQAVRKQGRWTVEHGRRAANNFHRSVRALLSRAGLSGRFHDLRRSCLSRWLANGLGEFDVMNLAGHSSFSTTHTFYLEVRRDLIDRARAAMETSEGGNLLRAWTLKFLQDEIVDQDGDWLGAHLLGRLELDIASVFVPCPGPNIVPPSKREQDQRKILAEYGPAIDVEEFMKGNPILIRDRLCLGIEK